ncbi:hypothetical protein H4V97_001921 [Flavobacterium sp. CG_23.5]|nr:hypothetical protein [Flavobacterium sp. CG_23.5]
MRKLENGEIVGIIGLQTFTHCLIRVVSLQKINNNV